MINPPVRLEQPDAPLHTEQDPARAEWQHLEQLKRNFTLLVVHELRHPLAVLLGYAKILEDESSGNTREYASIVAARAQQLKNIVDSLTVLQQYDAGELGLQLHSFPIAESIQAVIRHHRQHIRHKALRVELHLEPDLNVRADYDRIALVLTNLLSNAIKYSRYGGQITIQTRATTNDVVVSVHDDGIGIPPAEQARVFDRFYQVGNPLTREHSGMGIGLAVAKAIIELHHGRIWVESAPNQGSTFSFSLPRAYPLNVCAVMHQAVPALL